MADVMDTPMEDGQKGGDSKLRRKGSPSAFEEDAMDGFPIRSFTTPESLKAFTARRAAQLAHRQEQRKRELQAEALRIQQQQIEHYHQQQRLQQAEDERARKRMRRLEDRKYPESEFITEHGIDSMVPSPTYDRERLRHKSDSDSDYEPSVAKKKRRIPHSHRSNRRAHPYSGSSSSDTDTFRPPPAKQVRTATSLHPRAIPQQQVAPGVRQPQPHQPVPHQPQQQQQQQQHQPVAQRSPGEGYTHMSREAIEQYQRSIMVNRTQTAAPALPQPVATTAPAVLPSSAQDSHPHNHHHHHPPPHNHHRPGDQGAKCPHCGKSLKWEYNLPRHLQSCPVKNATKGAVPTSSSSSLGGGATMADVCTRPSSNEDSSPVSSHTNGGPGRGQDARHGGALTPIDIKPAHLPLRSENQFSIPHARLFDKEYPTITEEVHWPILHIAIANRIKHHVEGGRETAFENVRDTLPPYLPRPKFSPATGSAAAAAVGGAGAPAGQTSSQGSSTASLPVGGQQYTADHHGPPATAPALPLYAPGQGSSDPARGSPRESTPPPPLLKASRPPVDGDAPSSKLRERLEQPVTTVPSAASSPGSGAGVTVSSGGGKPLVAASGARTSSSLVQQTPTTTTLMSVDPKSLVMISHKPMVGIKTPSGIQYIEVAVTQTTKATTGKVLVRPINALSSELMAAITKPPPPASASNSAGKSAATASKSGTTGGKLQAGVAGSTTTRTVVLPVAPEPLAPSGSSGRGGNSGGQQARRSTAGSAASSRGASPQPGRGNSPRPGGALAAQLTAAVASVMPPGGTRSPASPAADAPAIPTVTLSATGSTPRLGSRSVSPAPSTRSHGSNPSARSSPLTIVTNQATATTAGTPAASPKVQSTAAAMVSVKSEESAGSGAATDAKQRSDATTRSDRSPSSSTLAAKSVDATVAGSGQRVRVDDAAAGDKASLAGKDEGSAAR